MKAFLIAILEAIASVFTQPKKEIEKVDPVKNPEIPTKEEIDSFPSRPIKLKRIAIIIGHGNGDGGASTWNGSDELKYNTFVAEFVKKTSKHKIETFYRTSSGIAGVARKAVEWQPDITIELHLNSYNKKAKGCEVLVLDGDKASAVLAKSFAKAFTDKFKRVVRGDDGVKWVGPREDGGFSLNKLSSVKQSILVEPFFCDNKDEWIEPQVYAKFMVEFLDTV
jgi:N-acetylmuramoyl-L-alanine amidase